MALDVDALRHHFPSLESGVAHFDGPGGTQTPRQVGEAIAATLTGPLSNRGSTTVSERNAEDAVAAFRAAYADFLGAAPDGIVVGRSATQLTYDFARHLGRDWGPGDELVVSRLDHDANVSPWVQLAAARGMQVRWLDFDPDTAELDPASVREALTDRTRVVALTGASNVLGTVPPVRQVADLAHQRGALVYLDAVHLAAHQRVDLATLGADLLVCSPYKFLGPHCGVLAGDPALLERLHPDKLVPSPDRVPERFELGTLPYETLAGATAAVDLLADLDPGGAGDRAARLDASLASVEEHEHALRAHLERGLAGLGEGVLVHSRAAHRTPTLLLTLPGRSCREATVHLARGGVLAPSGWFYAEQVRLRMALPDPHALRVGLAPYSTVAEVDRLLEGLADFLDGPAARPVGGGAS